VYQTIETERLITSDLSLSSSVSATLKSNPAYRTLLCTPSVIFFTCQASHSAAQSSRFCPFLFNIFLSLTNHQRISSPPANAARQDHKCGGETSRACHCSEPLLKSCNAMLNACFPTFLMLTCPHTCLWGMNQSGDSTSRRNLPVPETLFMVSGLVRVIEHNIPRALHSK